MLSSIAGASSTTGYTGYGFGNFFEALFNAASIFAFALAIVLFLLNSALILSSFSLFNLSSFIFSSASFFFFYSAANSALNYGSLSFLSITISLFLANSVIDPNPSKSSLSSPSSSAY